MIKTNDETYNIANKVSKMLSDKITSFFLFFFKEDKVAIDEKSILDTLKYLSIFIKICFIYKKKHKHQHI